jgi:hypothetical protein
VQAPLLLCALGALLSGCGGAGVSSGATVTVYVGAALCPGAKRELGRQGADAGSVRVRARCLAKERHRGRLSLATVGANSRRATEDSTAIAYLEAPDPTAARFAHPILESANIPWLSASSGSSGMRHILDAATEADPESLRDSVREALEGPYHPS